MVTLPWEFCRRKDMKGEWSKGLQVNHTFLVESLRGNTKRKTIECPRCGKVLKIE